ncbi:BZZ1 [Symbiodinium sp. CCMP2592]|nr:BZZ1 [Symbiodinium sp. CCMP2592]
MTASIMMMTADGDGDGDKRPGGENEDSQKAGYLAAASAAQMVVLMVQGPLALVVLTQWLLSAGASTMHQVAKVRTQDYDSLWLTGLVAQVALYGAVASMMVNPWADIVVMASRFEEVGDAAAQQLWGLGLGRCAEPKMQQSSSKGLKKQGASQDDEPFRKLATEVLDLSLFAPETSRNFESDQESDITYCLLLSVLSSKRTLGLGAYWDEEDEEKRVCLLVLAVEDCPECWADGAYCPISQSMHVKDVLSNPGVAKIHAGDGNELRERIRTSFGVDLRGELDLRTRAKAPQDVEARLEDLSLTGESDWLPGEFASKWQIGFYRVHDYSHYGLDRWKMKDLGTTELEAQHKRRMVLSGILEDDQILPPVPPSLAARGIVLQKGKDGTLQYMCQKCKAGPFPTLDSVDSHLHGAKHLHKEGREPELQLTPELQKEGFVLSAAGELECRLCEAGPFRDRQSLRLHRQSLQHRGHGATCARPPRMEEELRELPGYCNLLGNAFCCFLCDVSAPSLDGMLQHLAGKSHRKACQAHGEPEPLILCKDLVSEQVSDVYPLQGRLRDVDLEPIFRKGAGTWQEAGPGQKKPQGVAASEGLPKPPRAMVSKDDVENGSDPSYLAAKVGDKVIVVSDDAGSPWVWAEINEQRGWFPRDALVKKLPPWKLKKAASKTAKAAGPTTPAPPRVMVVRAEPLNFPDVPVGQQSLHAEAGDEVTILMVGEGGDWVWAECKGEQGMFPRRFLEEREAFEKVEQGVLESDFELGVTPPETPLDWSDVGRRRRFYTAEDVTEAFLRVAKMRQERLESQQMSASEILKEAIRKTSEKFGSRPFMPPKKYRSASIPRERHHWQERSGFRSRRAYGRSRPHGRMSNPPYLCQAG